MGKRSEPGVDGRAAPKLYLVDGTGWLFRCFFALPPLTAPSGLPANALFGFARILSKLAREEKPDLWAVALDAPGRTFRDDIFDEYKGHREPTPDALLRQLPYARDILRGLRVPLFEIGGVEADDVLATLARRGAEAGCEVWVVSADKDALQLVRAGVHVLRMHPDRRQMDAPEVVARHGVPPERIADLLALMGDSADNVPGVPGIGEKTAAKLLQSFGSLDSLLASLDSVQPERIRRALVEHRAALDLSRRLTVLRDDVPLTFDPAALSVIPPDRESLAAVYRQLGFRSLEAELGSISDAASSAPRTEPLGSPARAGAAPAGPAAEPPASLPLPEVPALEDASPASWERLAAAARASGRLAVVAMPPSGLALHAPGGPALAAELSTWHGSGSALRQLFSDPAVTATSTDLKGLVRRLDRELVHPVSFDDLALGAFLLDSDAGRYSLPALSLRHLHRALPLFDERRRPAGGDAVASTPLFAAEPDAPSDGAADSVRATARAHLAATLALPAEIERRLAGDGLLPLYRDVEKPMSKVLLEMERTGVRVDVRVLAGLSIELAAEGADLAQKIQEAAGETFNVNSQPQLARVLFEVLKLPVVRRGRTGPSTDVDVLEELSSQHPVPDLVLRYRRVTKYRNTYVDALPALVDPRTGRIHTRFDMTGAATGRLSSLDPNLQNIPVRDELGRRIRRAFVAGEPGWNLVSADYSQIELRLLAHLSADPLLTEAFRNGEDVHARTAAAVHGVPAGEVTPEMRRAAKAVNFGVVYGISPFGLARQLGIPQEAARTFIEAFFVRHSGVRRWIDETLEEARRQGFVATLLGRRRQVPEIGSPNRPRREFAERTAVNARIQGSAADLVKCAMVRISARLREGRLQSRMLLQVHDELVFESPPVEAARLSDLVRAEMEGAFALSVPLRVDVRSGSDWAAAH